MRNTRGQEDTSYCLGCGEQFIGYGSYCICCIKNLSSEEKKYNDMSIDAGQVSDAHWQHRWSQFGWLEED